MEAVDNYDFGGVFGQSHFPDQLLDCHLPLDTFDYAERVTARGQIVSKVGEQSHFNIHILLIARNTPFCPAEGANEAKPLEEGFCLEQN